MNNGIEKMKKVDGQMFPASDFAYTPNLEEPSTWKLPIFDARHISDALAALNKDFRGRQVELPADAVEGVYKRIAAKKRELGLT